LLVPSLQQHIQQFGHPPQALAADPGFFSAANEAAAQGLGVKRVSIPSNGTPGKQRKATQKKRWFKKLQKWRTGCEGRISVLKRRHGLRRSRYQGLSGMKRWVGWGVIADNLIHIAEHMAAKPATLKTSPPVGFPSSPTLLPLHFLTPQSWWLFNPLSNLRTRPCQMPL
jgi:IS5 family transposase